MNIEIEYSYSIVKYRHDIVAGEILNVGIILFSHTTGQIGIRYDHRYARLSQAFSNFDGETYKRVLDRLATASSVLARPLADNLFELDERSRYKDVAPIVRAAWPDQGLSYFAGPVFFGVTDDLEVERNNLFDRFVLSQVDHRDSQARFDDEQLWDRFKGALSARGVLQKLSLITLGPAEVEFEHAYKNERWHVFEPLSLDYADGASIKKRAYEMAGKAASVRDLDDFGTFTILVGKPRRMEGGHPLKTAMQILRTAPGNIHIVEEPDADSFASNLEREMIAHGILPSKENSTLTA